MIRVMPTMKSMSREYAILALLYFSANSAMTIVGVMPRPDSMNDFASAPAFDPAKYSIHANESMTYCCNLSESISCINLVYFSCYFLVLLL